MLFIKYLIRSIANNPLKGQGIVEYAGVFIIATVLIAGLLNTSYPQIASMFTDILSGFSAMLLGPLS